VPFTSGNDWLKIDVLTAAVVIWNAMASEIQDRGILQPEIRTFTYSHLPPNEENIYITIYVLGRKTIMNHSDKTIPYRLSPAELENLRILRKRMNPATSAQIDREQEETDARNAELARTDNKAEKKIP
jgi:hypothetical protein